MLKFHKKGTFHTIIPWLNQRQMMLKDVLVHVVSRVSKAWLFTLGNAQVLVLNCKNLYITGKECCKQFHTVFTWKHIPVRKSLFFRSAWYTEGPYCRSCWHHIFIQNDVDLFPTCVWERTVWCTIFSTMIYILYTHIHRPLMATI